MHGNGQGHAKCVCVVTSLTLLYLNTYTHQYYPTGAYPCQHYICSAVCAPNTHVYKLYVPQTRDSTSEKVRHFQISFFDLAQHEA